VALTYRVALSELGTRTPRHRPTIHADRIGRRSDLFQSRAGFVAGPREANAAG